MECIKMYHTKKKNNNKNRPIAPCYNLLTQNACWNCAAENVKYVVQNFRTCLYHSAILPCYTTLLLTMYSKTKRCQ